MSVGPGELAAAQTIEHKIGGGWLITTTDDGVHGFDWTASRDGVLWAKGWLRTRDRNSARIIGQTAGMRAFTASDECRELINALPSLERRRG